jgi:hypothetical protein
MGGTPKDIQKDWGLGGLLLMGDAKDGKKAGTMIWGGYPNLIWVSWIALPLRCDANMLSVGRSQNRTLRHVCRPSLANRRCEMRGIESQVRRGNVQSKSESE